MEINGQVPDGRVCSWIAEHYQVLAMRHYSWYATVRDLMLAGFCLLFCATAPAQVVQLHVQGDGFTGQGTAVCIGRTNDGFGLYLTARHNFRDAVSAAIEYQGRRIAVREMAESPTADVACFESEPITFYELAESEPIGESVVIPGYGPVFHGRRREKFDGVIRGSGVIEGDHGLHSITGDSGAPVLASGKVVGIVYGYQETAYRSDNADKRFPTLYTSLRDCRELLTQHYQCGPGGCKIWLRPEVRQPIGFLGLPVGPPRVVNVAEPVPRVYVPQDAPPIPRPDPISTQGPQGPPGRDGKDGRSITPAEVESIVSTWLDANRDELAKAAVDLSGLESRVSALERRPFTLILAEDGKEVDRETYAPGQPVILDIRRLKGGK